MSVWWDVQLLLGTNVLYLLGTLLNHWGYPQAPSLALSLLASLSPYFMHSPSFKAYTAVFSIFQTTTVYKLRWSELSLPLKLLQTLVFPPLASARKVYYVRAALSEALRGLLLHSALFTLTYLSLTDLSCPLFPGSAPLLLHLRLPRTLILLLWPLYLVESLILSSRIIHIFFLPLGLDVGMMWGDPLPATSLREFWVKQNRYVQPFLFQHIYLPFMRRFSLRAKGPPSLWAWFLGVLLSFAGSGAIHVYPLWVAQCQPWTLLLVMAYFLLQPFLMAIEVQLIQKSSLGESVRRVWVLCAVWGPTLILSHAVLWELQQAPM